MKTRLVLCTGMMRSGSTWSFNVCRLLAQVAAKQHDLPFWSGYLTLEQSEQFLSQSKGIFPGPTVVKAHGIGPVAQQYLTSGQGMAVCTFRDPRDCVVSLMQFSKETFDVASTRILQGLQMLDGYPPGRTLFVRYEDMLRDRLSEVRKIAAHLEVRADEATLRRIDELTGMEKSKEIMGTLRNRPANAVIRSADHRVDPKTWLHDNHIQDGRAGRWREELSAEQISQAGEQFSPWLKRWNYL